MFFESKKYVILHRQTQAEFSEQREQCQARLSNAES